MHLIFKTLIFLLITACSSDSDDVESEVNAADEHVWKGQTESINKAKQVEGMMLDSAEASRKAMDQQSQ